MCFLTLSTTCPLGFEDSKPDKLHPHLEGCPQAAQPGACPLQTRARAQQQECKQAHLAQQTARLGRMASSLLWAQGPGFGSLSSPRFIYLSFVWGEMGENQIQCAVLVAVGGKKGMPVSPERIPCIVALASWLGFSRQWSPFSLCPTARPHLPARLSALGPLGLPLPV